MNSFSMLLPLLLFVVFFGVAYLIDKKPIQHRSNVYPALMVIASIVLVFDFYRNGEKPYFVGVLLLIAASYIQKHFAAKEQELK